MPFLGTRCKRDGSAVAAVRISPSWLRGPRALTGLLAVVMCFLGADHAEAESLCWNPAEDLGGVNLTSGPAVVYRDNGKRIDVFYRGPNDHLWTSSWPDKPGGQWWSAPSDLGGVALTSGPCAVTRDGQRIDVFYRGPNNHLWTSSWPDQPGGQWWSAPSDLGGVALTSGPAAVARGGNRIDVFYRGRNNHLWTSSWPDKPDGRWWSAPSDLGGVELTSGPGSGSKDTSYIDVFYRGPNGRLWLSYWPDKPGGTWWGGAYDLGTQMVSEPATQDGNTVYFRGKNNHLWRMTRCNTLQTCGTFTFVGKTQTWSDWHGGELQENFSFDPAKCDCNCDKVWFVQILRPMDVNTGEIIQPHATQQARMVRSTDKAMNGWAIDRTDGYQLGYYHLKDDGSIITDMDTSGHATNISDAFFQFGSNSQVAAMHDVIQRGKTGPWWGRQILVQGVTAAVCLEGGCGARVLGMEEWIINYNSDNTVGVPTAHEGFAWQQTALAMAVQQWNAHLDGKRKAIPGLVF